MRSLSLWLSLQLFASGAVAVSSQSIQDLARKHKSERSACVQEAKKIPGPKVVCFTQAEARCVDLHQAQYKHLLDYADRLVKATKEACKDEILDQVGMVRIDLETCQKQRDALAKHKPPNCGLAWGLGITSGLVLGGGIVGGVCYAARKP